MPHFECGAFDHSATSPRGAVSHVRRGADITIVMAGDKSKLEQVGTVSNFGQTACDIRSAAVSGGSCSSLANRQVRSEAR